MALLLQRRAGNAATTVAIQRLARPSFQRGDVDQQVGVAQEKLDAVGAAPQLVVDAEFGGHTLNAVLAYQGRKGISRSGRLDDPTWAALDTDAPGGEVQADGTTTPVRGPNTPDPTGTRPAGNPATHPLLELTTPPMAGPAVAELHEKLNAAMSLTLPTAGGDLNAAAAIAFTDATERAVSAYQASKNGRLGIDGRVGVNTWKALDHEPNVHGAHVGRVEEEAQEHVRGEHRPRQGTARFDYALGPDPNNPTALTVRVHYRYFQTPTPPPPRFSGMVPDPGIAGTAAGFLSDIKSVWNQFKATEQPAPGQAARPPIPIDFEPTSEIAAAPGPGQDLPGGRPSGADNEVMVGLGTGQPDASHYVLFPGLDRKAMAAHEFGHHIGLADEYQQTAADHQRETGQEAPVGNLPGGGGAGTQQLADSVTAQLIAALARPAAERGQAFLGVLDANSIDQGAFAQMVARRFQVRSGQTILDACNTKIPESDTENSPTVRRRCTHPFLYNEDNLMGGAEETAANNAGAPAPQHAHGVEPRHVRHLADLVGNVMGGQWIPTV